jgi:hypothetical protein
MRKLLLTTAICCCLVVGLSACSSSKAKPSTASTSTTASTVAVDTATKAAACASYNDLEDALNSVLNTPADFQAAATKLDSVATTLSGPTPPAPASLVSSAHAAGAALHAGAVKMKAATTKAQAQAAAVSLIFGSSGASTPFTTWWTATCKK